MRAMADWGRLFIVVLILIVATQFFTRYVLNNSFGWTEELARYLLIMLGFVGSVTCVRKGSHICPSSEFFGLVGPFCNGGSGSVSV